MYVYINRINCNNISEYMKEFNKMISKSGILKYTITEPTTDTCKSITTNERLFKKALELDATLLYDNIDFKLISCKEESINIFIKYFALWNLNYTTDGVYIAQYNKKTDSIAFLSYTDSIFVERRIQDDALINQTIDIEKLFETYPQLKSIYELLLPVENPYFWAITANGLLKNEIVEKGIKKYPFALHYLIKNQCLSITLDEDKLTLYAVNKILKKNFFNKYRRLTTDNMLKIVKENPKLIGLFRFSTSEMQIHACIKDSNNYKYIINPCYYATKLFGKK